MFFILFYCRHLVQGILAKITAAASQITSNINTIVFVRRAIQVFAAREVNNNRVSFTVMLLFSDTFFSFSKDVAFLLHKNNKNCVCFLLLS